MVKVAVIGLGNMGSNHLRILMEMRNVEVVGVSDVNSEIIDEVVRKYKIPVYLDYKDLLIQSHPDCVIVVVPTIYHYKISIFAINRGIHVLVEKPISSTILEAQKMIKLAKKNNVILGVGHIERFNPAIIELKKRIDDDQLGKIFTIHSRRQTPYPIRIKDVGVASDLATHELDMMRYLSGSEVVELSSEVLYVMNTDREDIIFGLIRFKNNILGILDVNWITPTSVRELAITGKKGMFVVNYLTQDLLFYENPVMSRIKNMTNWESEKNFNVEAGNMTKYQITKREPLRSELESFIDSVSKGKKYLIEGNDGYQALLLAKQIVLAGKEKRRNKC
jgi:predicted dehydrogenase